MSQATGEQVGTRPVPGAIGKSSRCVCLACLCVVGALLAVLTFSASAQAAGASVEAWGYNYYGELGNGSTTTTGCQCIASPVAVSGLSDAVAVAGGKDHSLALRSDGTVVAWGRNTRGQLGNGTTNPSSTPVPVPGLSHVVAIAAGGDHSLALLKDGTVVAWGYNDRGQLGNGTTSTTGCDCISTPVAVGGLSHVVAIAAGNSSNTSMALRGDGTVRSWGENGSGELGNGTTDPSSTPVPVSGLSRVVAIAVGYPNGQALLSNGTVTDWGDNSTGQLGNGTTDPSSTPVPVTGLSHVVAIAAGGGYGEALLQAGGVKAWGANDNGQLGNGTTSTTGCRCSEGPVAVSGLAGATAIAAGQDHALALRSNRTVMAWGYNYNGQLGNGTTTTTGCQCIASPAAVSGVAGASAITSAQEHSLALTGPTKTLRVTRAGAGAGTVGGTGILCAQSCAHRYPQGAFAYVRAVPAVGSRFAGFSGACTGTGSCQLQMSADRGVVATFGPPKGTKITKAKINKKKRSASFSFGAPGAITGFQCKLVKPKAKHHKQKAHFSSCSSPKGYKHLKAGRYTFEVRALDILGADAAPARKTFTL